MPPTPDAEAALRAVVAARAVERLSRDARGLRPGQRREKRQALAEATDDRILEAVRAGATSADLARVLDIGVTWVRKRIRSAKIRAGDPIDAAAISRKPEEQVASSADEEQVDGVWLKLPQPGPVPRAPNIWRDAPICGIKGPPPWPVWAGCKLDRGHPAEHLYRRGKVSQGGGRG